MNNLKKQLKFYGLTEQHQAEARAYENFTLARVIVEHRGIYQVMTDEGEFQAQITGKLRHETIELAQFPAVGDFVMISYENSQDKAMIHQILSRKSVFLRSAIAMEAQAQVIASNIDVVFICMSVNRNYNLNRLERYLSIAWDSGAKPVIVLTKSDLCENLSERIQEVEEISLYSDVMSTSLFENNLPQFEPYLQEGMTAAFIGSSGVGKSTLINEILGENLIETRKVGGADKGRHTTTGRALFPCLFGGAVIDTPGMRELGLESADFSQSFADIEEIAEECKFNNCSHQQEPHCALQEAVRSGRLKERRLKSYLKLKTEASYDGLNSKQIENQKLERMFKEVGGMKNARKFAREKKNRI